MDTGDPLYEIDLTDLEPARPERHSSRRALIGLLAGTVAVTGIAGFLFGRSSEPRHVVSLTVEVISSTTTHQQTSDVAHSAFRAPPQIPAEIESLLPSVSTASGYRPWAAYSPDGKTLAVSDTDQVMLWDIRSGTADLTSRRTIPATLSRFAFVADDLLAVAQIGDATIQFWSAGRVPAVLQTYTGPVGRDVSLTANRDGTLTVTQIGIDQSTTQVLRITKRVTRL